MTLQTIRELLARRPFQPFRVIMSSGKSHEVLQPEMAWLTRSDLLVGIDGEDGVPGDFRFCSLSQVASVEPITTATGGQG
jgi:hypothetical protein